MDMPAIAVTDHGNTFGAYEFYKASKATGVKPIIGIEAYLTPKTHRRSASGSAGATAPKLERRRRVRRWRLHPPDDVGGEHRRDAQPVPAELAGLAGGVLLQAADGPRAADQTYATGLIATTGCPSGEVQTYLRLGRYDEAVASAAEFRDIFGAEQLLRRADGPRSAIENRVRADLLRIARDLKLPLVATNDLHYAHQSDAAAHEVLLCVQTGSTMADANRFKLDGDSYYLKSPAEMRALFAELPEACDNTLAIAERCDVSFTEGNGTFMPRYPCPPGENEDSWFVREVETGLRPALPDGIPDDVRTQAEFETAGSSCRWASPATSWSSPTSSTGPRRTASGSGRAAARARGRWPRTRCGSPTSTHSSTG